MSGDALGRVKVDFETNRVKYEQDIKSMLGVTKEARSTFSQIMGETNRLADRLSGADATRRLGIMEQAVQKLGGMGKVSQGQLEGLRKEIDSLVNAGGKLPSLFESLHASGGKMPMIGDAIAGPKGPGLAAQLGMGLSGLSNVPGLQGASAQLTGIAGSATAASAALGPVGVGLVAAGAGAAAMSAALVGATSVLKEATLKVVDQAGQLIKLREQYGATVEELQELKFAGADVDVELQSIGTGIKNMQANLAKDDSVFGRIGLDIEHLKSLNPRDAFVEVGRAVNALGTDYERTAAAGEIFGKGVGSELIPLFKTDLPDAFEEARRRGLVMSTETAEGAEALGDELRSLGDQWDAVLAQAGQAIAQSPEVRQVFESLREVLVRATSFLADHKDEMAAVAATAGNAALGVGKIIVALEQLAQKLLRLTGIKPSRALELALAASGVVMPGLGGGAALGALSLGKGLAALGGDQEDLPDFSDVKGDKSSTGVKPFISEAELARRKAAAEKAAADAERVRAAWQKGAEEARKDWDKFYAGMHERGDAAVDGIRASLDKAGLSFKEMGAKHAKDVMANLQNSISIRELAMVIDPATGLWTRYGDVVEQELANAAEGTEVATKRTVDWGLAAKQAFASWAGIASILGAVSQGLDLLGVDMDSTAGKVLGLAQSGAQLGASIAKGDIAGMIAGGFAVAGSLKSIFDKPEFKRIGEDVGRRFGVAISEGLAKQIEQTERDMGISRHMAELLNLSAIMGESGADPRTFGAHIDDLMNGIAMGAVPAREGMEELGSAFDQVREAAEAAGAVGDETLTRMLRRARELGQLTPEMKAFVQDRLDSVIAGVEQFVGGLAKLDGEFDVMGANSATVFMAAFNAVAKERGEIEAVKALGDSYEVLREKLSALGDETALAILAPFERWRNYMDNEVLAGAMDSVSGLNQIMRGLLDTDFLDVDQFRAAESAAAGLFNHMTEGGMDTKSALQAVAPSIQAAIAAAERFGVPLSDDMQKLKELAEANGFAFSPDPMTQAAEAMDRVATALEKILGIGGDVADTFGDIANRASGIQLPGGGGGVGHGGYGPAGRPEFEPAPGMVTGGVFNAPMTGAPFIGHGLEGVIPLEGPGAGMVAKALAADVAGMLGQSFRGASITIGDVAVQVPDNVADPEGFAAAAVEAIARALSQRNVRLTDAITDLNEGRAA
jgi:hypothetical protein